MKILLVLILSAYSSWAVNIGDTLVYNGVANTAQATNTLNVSGTNVLIKGTAKVDSMNATNQVTAAGFNKVAITAPATAATLTIANNKTATINNTLTFSGTDSSTVAFGTGGTAAYLATDLSAFAFASALTWPDGVRQVFNPNGTVAGINVGAQAGDPSTPVNGDLWYDSTGNLLRARINGASVSLGAASGVTAATYGDGTHVGQFTVNAQGIVTAASSVAITGGAGSQTPWTQDIDGGLFSLTNVGNISLGGGAAALTMGDGGTHFFSIRPPTMTTSLNLIPPTAPATGIGHYVISAVTNDTMSISAVVEGDMSSSDVTTLNASTSKHGFAPKGDNNAAHYLDGTLNWSTPAGGGGGSATNAVSTISSNAVNIATAVTNLNFVGFTLLTNNSGNVSIGAPVSTGTFSSVYNSTTLSVVTNTTAETTLVTFTVTGNSMSTNGRVRVTILGDFLNNNTETYTVRVKYGGTTMYDDSFTAGNSATRRPYNLILDLCNLGLSNSQTFWGTFQWAANPAGTTVGLGDMSSVSTGSPNFSGTASVDSAADQTLLVTIQPSASTANGDFRALHVDAFIYR